LLHFCYFPEEIFIRSINKTIDCPQFQLSKGSDRLGVKNRRWGRGAKYS